MSYFSQRIDKVQSKFHGNNTFHFFTVQTDFISSAIQPTDQLLHWLRYPHYKLTRRKITNNLASVLYIYLFLLFVFLQIKCQKSHEMECLQGIGPVTTWWNLMADCEYRRVFFFFYNLQVLIRFWRNVNIPSGVSFILSKFNRMPGSNLLGFNTKALEDTTASICVALKWLPPGRPWQDLGHKAFELCCVVAR